LHIEIQDDVLIIRGDGTTFRYEKETLLPAIVQPDPHSRQFQNGLLELRLKKL
jgi:HSP20 family molecular chaperone IbpA